MAMVNWPTTGRKVPDDVGDHAARLKAEFDSVSDTVNASLSNSNLLPAGLESRIEKGIEDGIVEARSNGYCPKWSEIDKTIFSKVLLKNITTASALEARDRVPLPQFHGLHQSFDALYNKLRPQSSAASQTRPAIVPSVATQTTPTVDQVSAASREKTDAVPVKAPKRVATAPQEEKEKSVSSEDTDSDTGTDTSEGDEEDSEQNVNVGDGQEAAKDEGGDSGEESSEDSSDDHDAASGSGDRSKTDCESDTEEGRNQDVVGEHGVCNTIRDGQRFITNITLTIDQQATVNKLEGMTAAELSVCLHLSLKKYLRKQQLASRSVQIADATLLDDGHVNLNLQVETEEALQHLIDSDGWDQDFERLVCPPSVTTYKVSMVNVKSKTVNLQNRKAKAATIRMLASVNHKIRAQDQVTRVGPIVRDIYWPNNSLQNRSPSLTVEFLDPEDANYALRHGIIWPRKRHTCEREEKEHKLVRCNKCQAYGHLDNKCSSPQRCGRCAGFHHKATCTSTTVKCSSCGQGHVARNKGCPAKLEARRKLEFPTNPSPQAVKLAAEVQETPSSHVRHSTSAARTQTETSMPSPVSLDAPDVNIKAESEHFLREASPSPDIQPDYASVKRELDDLRRMIIDLQSESPSLTKRRVEEAFAGGAEAESSYKGTIPMKRIKREQPSREGSMGLYRQPSPFIINRS